MKVCVVRSPYSFVRSGAIGEVIAEKHPGTRYHVYRVEFNDGRSSLFYADELKALGAV